VISLDQGFRKCGIIRVRSTAFPVVCDCPSLSAEVLVLLLWCVLVAHGLRGRPTTPVINEYMLPVARSAPEMITAGPDGNLWFSQEFNDQIGKITPECRATHHCKRRRSEPKSFIESQLYSVRGCIHDGRIGHSSRPSLPSHRMRIMPSMGWRVCAVYRSFEQLLNRASSTIVQFRPSIRVTPGRFARRWATEGRPNTVGLGNGFACKELMKERLQPQITDAQPPVRRVPPPPMSASPEY
jgi:hypothetical protein